MDLTDLTVKDEYILNAVPKVDRRSLYKVLALKAGADHFDYGFRDFVDKAFKLFGPLAPDANVRAFHRAVRENDIHVGNVVAAALPGGGFMRIQGSLDTVNQSLMFDSWIGLPGNSAFGEFEL
jgi:hypothetical protein